MYNEMFDLALDSVESGGCAMLQGMAAHMVLKGSVTLELNSLRRDLNADDVLVVNNRDIYSLSSNFPNIVLSLRLPIPFLERECPELLNYRYDCNSAAGEKLPGKTKFFEVKRSLIRMMLAHYKREDGYALAVKRSLMDLLHNLYINFRAVPTETTTSAMRHQKDIGDISGALSLIHENYRSGVSLADAATSAGMSPQYFSKRFKQKMGLGFLEYLNRIRLDSAVRELLQTRESIIKIAVNNGFSGSKPFTALFKKIYGQTPKNYKRRELGNRGGAKTSRGGDSAEKRPLFGAGGCAGLDDLLKYVALYDIHHGYRASTPAPISVSPRHLSLSPDPVVDAEQRKSSRLSLPGKIFKIGKLAEALDDRLRDQLITAQKKLRGDYIYFQGVFEDGILPCPENSYFKGYDYGRLFNFFLELGLTPFVRVDLSSAPQSVAPCISDFIGVLSENRPMSCWRRKIRFEVVHSRAMETPLFLALFYEIYRALKTRFPSAGVGFHAVSSYHTGELAILREKLAACKEAGCPPDFLSLTIDPALDEDHAALGESSYGSIKNCGALQIESVKRVSAECGVSVPELYATEWNTLSGRTSIESMTFFRAALIAAELLSCGESVSAVAYWLNSQSKELSTGKVDNRVLALFFYGLVKRPPYYLLYIINKLQDDVIFRSERLVVTAAGPGEYAVLVANPCYFDPLYSVEEAYVAMETIRVEARLTDIPKGRYRFKVFLFEKKHSSVFDRWSRVGYPSLNDEDATDYLEHAILPEFNIFEDDIDGSYTLSSELGYNGVALYYFRKIG
jgi:beta-xylosidase/AraC-like DNA-binding protein